MGMGFAPTWLLQVIPASHDHFNHCPDTSSVVVVPSSTHCRKALLQLNDSYPAEFPKLVESARSATSEKTESRPQSESEATTDTSSDIGSTVRELNRQLE